MKSPWRWPALFLLASGLCLLVAMPVYESPLLVFMHENLERMTRFIGEHRAIALVIYVIVYVASIALSFPAAILLTLIGGYGFGIVTGPGPDGTTPPGKVGVGTVTGGSVGRFAPGRLGSAIRVLTTNGVGTGGGGSAFTAAAVSAEVRADPLDSWYV